MPHRIDIDGISQNMFLLRNFAFASKPFCQTYRVNRCERDEVPFGWDYYIGWLKTSVSEILLETAIKMRVVEDFTKHDDIATVNFAELAVKAIGELVPGRFQQSRNPLSLRDCFNKIVHALEFRLVWLIADDTNGAYEYWNGDIQLVGTKGKECWECELYVIEFTEAIDNLVSLLSEHVDWHHVYKYDE